MKEDKIVMGFDEATVEEPKKHAEAPKKPPFAVWEVEGTEYKLVLRTAEICKLEGQYKTNLLLLLDDLMPLSTMLTIIQAAMSKYNHGMTFVKVQNLFDSWTEEGHTQTDLMTEVIVPIYEASGFFTQEMKEALNSELTEEN